MTASPHAATLTINHEALADNWRLLNARAAPGVAGAVVKANAYGLGIEAVVPTLAKAGCAHFFVAHLSEGIRARKMAPKADIYVLNGMAAFDRAYWEFGLRPVLGTAEEIALWLGARRKHAIRPGDRIERPALHIDTGMNRLGLRIDEARAFIEDGGLDRLKPALVMSHLVSAEMPDDPINIRQAEAFSQLETLIHGDETMNQAAGKQNPDIRLSLCNSSGLFRSDMPGCHISRPGYALYGGNPMPGQPNPMSPVIRLEAPIVQITHVPEGEPVGYNSNFIARRDSRIATISVGYADGYPRNAGAKPDRPGGVALVAGRECPFAGNVSMDLITLDITDLPEGTVKAGDLATLIGDSLDIDRVGAFGKTIGYEILTNLGQRYRRVQVSA